MPRWPRIVSGRLPERGHRYLCRYAERAIFACAGFKNLNDCVAALHVSHNLNLKFNCLKWDVIGAKPLGDVKSCPAPSNDKAVDLSKAIRTLKPAANSRTEAKTAEKRAREDIKDAS